MPTLAQATPFSKGLLFSERTRSTPMFWWGELQRTLQGERKLVMFTTSVVGGELES